MPKFNANKFWIAMSAACTQAGIVLADGDITQQDALLIGGAFLGALGVWKVANSRVDPTPEV